MEQILCVYCGDLFEASPRHKNQIACKKPECQRARKADWQRHKMKIDPVYKASQRISQWNHGDVVSLLKSRFLWNHGFLGSMKL